MAFGVGSLLMGMSCVKKTSDSPQHYEDRDGYACGKDSILFLHICNLLQDLYWYIHIL
jgi:hypothetical protein